MPRENIQDFCNRTITIDFDEGALSCSAWFQGQLIGKFSFRHWDEADSELLLLTHCHLQELPGFTGCGIGTAMIKLISSYGYRVMVQDNDGIKRDDGSYLTENGVAFAASLVRKRLAFRVGSRD